MDAFLDKFMSVPMHEKRAMLDTLKRERGDALLYKGERKKLLSFYRKELVKRSILLKIAAAWIITVPLAGLLAAMLYFTIRGNVAAVIDF